jgi:hypothetical protein
VRWPFFWFVFALLAGLLPSRADETIVQEFSGNGPTTTGLFKVQDRWEIRWNARQVVSVAVMNADGTIVAGASGVLRGSLFVPLGGPYYCKITDGTTPPPLPAPSPAPTTPSTPAPVAPSTNLPPSPPSTNAAPAPASTNAPADDSPYGKTISPAPSAPPSPAAEPVELSWHLQVVQLGNSVASDQSLTVYSPFFVMPDAAVVPAPAPLVVPDPVLTDAQIKSVVLIKGDRAHGTGFFVQTPDGNFLAAPFNLIAANPNLQITTGAGAAVTTLSVKGAVDRPLVLFAVKDDGYSYLPMTVSHAGPAAIGDALIVPEIPAPNGNPVTTLVGKVGKVVAAAPERIDLDNPMGRNDAGSPIIEVKSGIVVAMLADVKKVTFSDSVAKAWPANPAPGSQGIIPYFGLPLGGVTQWETYDNAKLLAETQLLARFHDTTRSLDSYVNGKHQHEANNGPPDNNYFNTNAKLHHSQQSYAQLAAGADRDQRYEAARELLVDLQAVADTDVLLLQDTSSFYMPDQNWAKEELAYRAAIKQQLADLGNNIPRLDIIARSH